MLTRRNQAWSSQCRLYHWHDSTSIAPNLNTYQPRSPTMDTDFVSETSQVIRIVKLDVPSRSRILAVLSPLARVCTLQSGLWELPLHLSGGRKGLSSIPNHVDFCGLFQVRTIHELCSSFPEPSDVRCNLRQTHISYPYLSVIRESWSCSAVSKFPRSGSRKTTSLSRDAPPPTLSDPHNRKVHNIARIIWCNCPLP